MFHLESNELGTMALVSLLVLVAVLGGGVGYAALHGSRMARSGALAQRCDATYGFGAWTPTCKVPSLALGCTCVRRP